MTLKVIDEINSRLKNLHRKNKSFSSVRQRLLRNAPFNLTLTIYTQPDILISNKIQIKQNKYIWFCLKLHRMAYISKKDFETVINWLP